MGALGCQPSAVQEPEDHKRTGKIEFSERFKRIPRIEDAVEKLPFTGSDFYNTLVVCRAANAACDTSEKSALYIWETFLSFGTRSV